MTLEKWAGLLVAAGLLLSASPSLAAPGVSIWNRECIRFYRQWKTKPNHKAFAVSTSTSGEGCGAVWGSRSLKEAEEGARKWCRRGAEDGAHCRITESH